MPIPDHLRKADQSIYEFKWQGAIPTREKIGHKDPSCVSRIFGCMVMVRDSDGDRPLMIADSSGLIAMDLVGYAIVPIEDWNEMVSMAEKYSVMETTKLLEKVRKPVVTGSKFDKIKRYIRQILHIGK